MIGALGTVLPRIIATPAGGLPTPNVVWASIKSILYRRAGLPTLEGVREFVEIYAQEH